MEEEYTASIFRAEMSAMRMRQNALQIINKWRGDGARSETTGTVLRNYRNNITECYIL
jgi:hypothetical protein